MSILSRVSSHRRSLLALLFALWSGALIASAVPASAPRTHPAPALAPQIASYRIAARLDPAAKTVTGTERITYRNPSQDTLNEIWLRLYLRAFGDPDSVWMRESGSTHRGYAVNPAERGDITVSTLTLAGADLLASATITDTLMRVPLPQPLAPGGSIELDVAWVSKLPRVFARTGYGGRDDTFFMVGQWYPKMAVYDRGRWDTEPWHTNAEFFHDFGSYDVSVTVPQEYIVAGAGVPAGESSTGDSTKTLRFTSEDVTDFAFAASPDFLTRSARAGDVEVVLYYLPEHAVLLDEYIDTSVGALQAYSSWYGAYPHPRLTVVDVPDSAGGAGGMEYPTLVTGGTLGAPPGTGMTALIVAHEIAHQWWPMQTATNEGREPWLDEGLTEYSSLRYLEESGRRIGSGPLSFNAATTDRLAYALDPRQPATLPAWQYPNETSYGAVYFKTSLGLWTLESIVGTTRFRAAMADYLAAYRFKHPTGENFRASLERSLGENLGWFFEGYMERPEVIDYAAGSIANESAGSAVWVVREGGVAAPVEIAVTRENGERTVLSWDGQSELTKFSFDPGNPVVRVEVDSERKLKAELNIVNNATTLRPEVGPAITLGGRLAFWLQAVVQLVGLFG